MEPNPLAALDDDLWARLDALSTRCSVSMTRDAPARATLLHCARTWHVHLQNCLGMAHDWVGTEAPTLAEAVAAAVGQAEARGWAACPATGASAPPIPPPPPAPPATAGGRPGSPAASWARLRAFDPDCQIRFARRGPNAHPEGAGLQVWRVTIKDECEILQREVSAEHAALADALAGVLDQAEARGWQVKQQRPATEGPVGHDLQTADIPHRA